MGACGQLCGFCRYCIDMYRLYRWYLFQHISNAYLILVKVAMLRHLLLRAPFHDQAKELTLADLAKEQRVEKGQAGCIPDFCQGCHVAGLVVEGPFPQPG